MINHAFFKEGWFDAIRARAAREEHVARLVDSVLESAKTSDHYETLAFAYYYTGEESYVERAHKKMLAEIETERWENHDFVSTDLGTGSYCISLATGYSLFADKIAISSDIVREVSKKSTGESTFEFVGDYENVQCRVKATVDAVQTHNASDAMTGAWGRTNK